MKRKISLLIGAVLAASVAGCSTFINDTAPTKTPNTVYAVGGKEGFFVVNSKAWVCSSIPSGSTDCRPIEVVIQ